MSKKLVSLAAALFLGVAPTYAQEGTWEYSTTFYGFMPATTTTLETPGGAKVSSKLSFSDALDNLDGALMGAFQASNGRFTLALDYMYTDLSFTDNTVGPLYSSALTSTTTQILTGLLGYRVYETASMKLDLGGGFRWFDTDTTLNLTGNLAPSVTLRSQDDWTDPIIGARATIKFTDRLSGTGYLDYGGFKKESETWQVLLTAGYDFNDKWAVVGGYRYIEVSHQIGNLDFKFKQSGPVLGLSFRF